MPANSVSNAPRWGHYFIASIVGGTFFIILMESVWHITLEEKQNEFFLEAALIRETATRNVYSGNDAVNSVTAYLNSNPDVSQDEFDIFTDDLLGKYPYIESINHYARSSHGGNDLFSLAHGNSRWNDNLSIAEYFLSEYKDPASWVGFTDEAVLIVTGSENEPQRKIWLLNFLSWENTPFDAEKVTAIQLINGIAAILITPEKLLEDYTNISGQSIAMYGSADNLSGRQLLYFNNRKDALTGFWKINVLLDEKIIRLPQYSIKLDISQDIYFSDLDYHLIFIAILLGAGISLLLFALIRAKEIQANELLNRNILIEHRVEEQTRELAVARNNALQASRMKSDFLAIMSHEIRTPLNAIIGMANLLSETKLSDEQKEYIRVFHNAGDTLFGLVNNVLDLSKIEANQMVLEDIPFDLVVLIEKAVEIYALRAAEKNIDIVCKISPELNQHRIGDPSRLRQIILNLINNALKFTNEGEIVVDVCADENDESGERLKFAVSDTGIGIPEDKLDSIFASFTQVDISTTRKYGGTGLGLTISKSLVELMGGELRVESMENEGTTFSFSIALQQQGAVLNIEQSLQGKSALIIDDHVANPAVVSTLLETKGMTSKIIENKSATSKFDTFAFSDIVFVDSAWIFKEGNPVLERLLTKHQKFRVALMINPAQMHQHIALAKEKGLDNFIIKPIKRDELISTVEKIVLGRQATQVPEGKTAPELPSIGGKHILLVEDNPDNRLLINAYLKSTTHKIEEAENGQIAVELFKSGKYDLVLMDVQMPVMDGHDAIRAIRQWEEQKNAQRTPIISLTAHAIKEEIDKCFKAGCDFYLSKPIKKSTLIQAIDQLD